jgi:RNA polymerase sigma-70 factor, ECF subfamily
MSEKRNNTGKQNKEPKQADQTDVNSNARAIELVDRASGGDIEAFGNLYRIYIDQIYRYIYYRVNNRMLAEDITEDVFLKAWKSVKSCKGKGQTFLSWLYRIAHNQIVDNFRSSRREGLPLEENYLSTSISSDSELDSSLKWQEVVRVITTLPPNQEQVMTLKFMEGLSNQEVGAIMGKSEGAIRILQMRALITIRQAMQEDWADR